MTKFPPGTHTHNTSDDSGESDSSLPISDSFSGESGSISYTARPFCPSAA